MDYIKIKKLNDGILLNKEKYSKYIRPALYDIEKLLESNLRGVVLGGLRQIGKTTILKQMRIKNNKSLFITIDNNPRQEELDEVIDVIENAYYENNIQLFLIDEIQNIQEWGYFLTNLSNVLENAKFVVSGSASLDSIDSKGSARFTTYRLLPLSLKEYIDYKELGESVILSQVFKYAIGYRAIFAYTDQENIDKHEMTRNYVKSFVFDDIKKYHPHINIDDLEKILDFVKCNTSGEIVKMDLIKKGIGEQYKTIKTKYAYLDKHINILEKYNLIKILKRYSYKGGIGRSYKIYMNPHLYLMLLEIDTTIETIPNGNIGYFYESYIYFYNLIKDIKGYIKEPKSEKPFSLNEIDFFTNNKWIEVKMSKHSSEIKKSLSKLFKECNQKNINKEIISLCSLPKITGFKNTNFFKLFNDKSNQ